VLIISILPDALCFTSLVSVEHVAASDILQTLVYQLSVAYPEVRSRLKEMNKQPLSPEKMGGIDGLFKIFVNETHQERVHSD